MGQDTLREVLVEGRQLLQDEKHEEALQAFTRAIELNPLNPGNAIAWRGKGAALLRLERHEEALHAFDSAIDLNPKDAVAWRGKGYALITLDRLQEAAQALDQAFDLGNGHGENRCGV